MEHRQNLRRFVGAGASVLLVAALMAFHVADRAGAGVPRCVSHLADSRDRAAHVTGDGSRTVVIGDSWSVGLGLEDLRDSWPSQLSGGTLVAGFSGSGFSSGASSCAGVAFADRAAAAVLDAQPADLVVVQGGLNDHDQSDVGIARGFRRLMTALRDRPVVVVGPATAPVRADAVPRVDRLLADLCDAHGVPYVATSDLDLAYLGDGLHLTPEGHATYGGVVADRIARAVVAAPRHH